MRDRVKAQWLLVRLARTHPKKLIMLASVILLYLAGRCGWLKKFLLWVVTIAKRVLQRQLTEQVRCTRKEMIKQSVLGEDWERFEKKGEVLAAQMTAELARRISGSEVALAAARTATATDRGARFEEFIEAVIFKLLLTISIKSVALHLLFTAQTLATRRFLQTVKSLEDFLKQLESDKPEVNNKPLLERVTVDEKAKFEELRGSYEGFVPALLKEVAEATAKVLLAGKSNWFRPPLSERVNQDQLFCGFRITFSSMLTFPPSPLSSEQVSPTVINSALGSFQLVKAEQGLLSKWFGANKKKNFVRVMLQRLEGMVILGGVKEAAFLQPLLDIFQSKCFERSVRWQIEINLCQFYNKLLLLFKKLNGGEKRLFSADSGEKWTKLIMSIDKIIEEELLDEQVAATNRDIINKKIKWAFFMLKMNKVSLRPDNASQEGEGQFDVLNSTLTNIDPFCEHSQLAVLLCLREKFATELVGHHLRTQARSIIFNDL